jgi:A118 family predicted phage portal protein
MPLPAGGKVPWPPTAWRHVYNDYSQHSAWYSGDPNILSAWYGAVGVPEVPGRGAGFFGQTYSYAASSFETPLWKRWQFWGKRASDPVNRYRLHLPLAADIAQTSADLLFSEQPKLYIPEAHEETAVGNSKEVQQRLLDLADDDGIYNTLLEAAEICAALSGVFLRVSWDRSVADHPILTAVHPDSAIPEFAWGRLSSVVFWRYAAEDGDNIYRLLESHDPGYITHGLYKGTREILGFQVPLSTLPQTMGLLAGMELEAQAVTEELPMPTGLKDLTAVYIPNIRPNRRDRSLPIGRSDYQGVEGLMDALDETYTSWMRELRLCRARIMLPYELLNVKGKGKGADFDQDQEIFVTTNDLVGEEGGKIEFIQPAIRTAEHMATATDLVMRIVVTAGYSPESFGLKGEGRMMMTATEVMAKQQRSMITRAKKASYWSEPVERILTRYLELDTLMFGGPGVFEPTIEFADSVEEDPKDTAQTIQLLDAAMAVSLETKVKMAHPEWEPEEVKAEVKAIQDEKTAIVQLENPVMPGGNGGPPGGPPAPAGAKPPSGSASG